MKIESRIPPLTWADGYRKGLRDLFIVYRKHFEEVQRQVSFMHGDEADTMTAMLDYLDESIRNTDFPHAD